jgi:hypothetical protein
MSWLTEDSTPALVLGVIFEALLVLALVKSGQRWLLYAILGLGVAVGAIVWIEKHTLTDTKRVRATLETAAAAMERGDLPGVLDRIAPSAALLRQQAQMIAKQVEVRSVSLSGLVVKVNRFNNPPTATADFTAFANIVDRTGMVPYNNVVRHLRLTLRWEHDRWLVDGYAEGSQDAIR